MVGRTAGLLVVVLLAMLPPWAWAQPVPFHEQDRRWYPIGPDTLAESHFLDARSVYQDGRRVLFATSGHGLLKSTDEGASWYFVHRPDAGDWDTLILQVAAAPTHPDTLYGVARDRIYMSIDGGETWEGVARYSSNDARVDRSAESCGSGKVQGSIAPGDAGPGIAVAPYDPGFVFALLDRTYTMASRDGGKTWSRWVGPTGCGGGRLTFALSPGTPGRVFVNTLADGDIQMIPGVFKISVDWGETFETAHMWTNNGGWAPSLFADTSDVLYSGPRVSYDLGATWTTDAERRSFDDMFVGGGLGIEAVFDSDARELILHAGYDQGKRWHAIEGRLSTRAYGPSATLDRRDSTVYVATQHGLYAYARPGALATPTEQPDVVPEALRLEAYPNPMRERATVTYALPEAGRVRLAAYDVLGREVAVLVDRRQAAGRHRAPLETGAWPAGVYLVRLSTPAATRVVKVTRIR